MMRAAYSPIFSESRDFSCALFDASGRMIAQGRFNPAHLGAIGETVRCVLDELGADSFEPGDVVVHNDPFRGGCHMPEHMLLRPVFREGRARRLRRDDRPHGGDRRRHDRLVREHRDRGLPGGPAPAAGEARPRAASRSTTSGRSSSRTTARPGSTWGDLHAMIGSLHLAERRLQELLDRYGEQLALAVWDELLAHGERLMRRRIEAIPDGEYTFEDVMEGDGHTRDLVTMRVARRRARRPRDRRLHGLRPAGTRPDQRDLRRHGLGHVQRLPPGQRHRDPAERRRLRRA